MVKRLLYGGDAYRANGFLDDTLTGEQLTTSSVANRDDMFGTLGATETLREESLVREKINVFKSHRSFFYFS